MKMGDLGWNIGRELKAGRMGETEGEKRREKWVGSWEDKKTWWWWWRLLGSFRRKGLK